MMFGRGETYDSGPGTSIAKRWLAHDFKGLAY